jgi:hypothetical protein
MADFKKDKYEIIKKTIPKVLSEFAYNYLLIKKQVAATMFYSNFLHKDQTEWGTFRDPQVPNTFAIYGDPAMEALLLKTQPVVEKCINDKLLPTYSYARVYKKGDILQRHKDRISCEISTTMNLGGDVWPIYLNPDPKAGHVYGKPRGIHKIQTYQPSTNKKEIKINLKPGDMLLYSGCDLEHWREPFEGRDCAQVFLHYNRLSLGDKNIFDNRKHLGLPVDFKNKV